MLANGATLGVSTSSGSGSYSYTNLPGLVEIPDMGADPEKVDVTALADPVKQYELGIGDPGDMQFTFNFKNSASGDSWRQLKTIADAGTLAHWQVKLKDNTTITFDGQAAIKLGGGGVNDALKFTLSIGLASALTIAPSA